MSNIYILSLFHKPCLSLTNGAQTRGRKLRLLKGFYIYRAADNAASSGTTMILIADCFGKILDAVTAANMKPIRGKVHKASLYLHLIRTALRFEHDYLKAISCNSSLAILTPLSRPTHSLLIYLNLPHSILLLWIKTAHTTKASKLSSTANMFCSPFLVFLLWQGYRVSTALAQICYSPDGSEIGNDTACGPTSSNRASACCDP